MKNCAFVLAFASCSLAGCVSQRGLPDVPVITRMPPRAVVSLADVVNNMKCDMQEFLSGNRLITRSAMDIGGTLTFTLDRSNSVETGLKVGIPIATGIKFDANAGRSSALAFGETVTAPFLMRFDKESPLAQCEHRNQLTVIDSDGTVERVQLRQPILNLAELKTQLGNVLRGEPKIAFGDFQFSGSIAFTRETKVGADINVIIINPSASDKISADYKIDYKIGTNWKQIISDAKFSMDAPATQPTVDEEVIVRNVTNTPKKTTAKPVSTGKKAAELKRRNSTRWLRAHIKIKDLDRVRSTR